MFFYSILKSKIQHCQVVPGRLPEAWRLQAEARQEARQAGQVRRAEKGREAAAPAPLPRQGARQGGEDRSGARQAAAPQGGPPPQAPPGQELRCPAPRQGEAWHQAQAGRRAEKGGGQVMLDKSQLLSDCRN